MLDAERALTALHNAELVYPAEGVVVALDRMAAEITAQLRACDPVVLVVMNGGLIPAAQLFTRMDFPFQIDYLHVTRYRGGTRGGELSWSARPHLSLAGRVVLVVDDIFDEGATLKAILDTVRQAGAQAVYSAVLVNKIHNRKVPGLTVDFIGLEADDRYIFGCGMDYQEYWRNLPDIYALKES